MNLNFETDGLNFNSKGKPDEIATPQNICDDMSNLFDFKDCNRKIWADIYCKTGNTLESLKKHGVNKENILAICDNKQSQMLVCRKLYGKILPEIEVEITVKSLEAYKITRRGQVYWVSSWQDIVKNNYQNAYNIVKFVILKEMEKTMSLEFTSQDDFQINNIIMNPPYNNDIYLDFLKLAHTIASDNVVAITPIKHYFLRNIEKYASINEEILNYIDKLIFYQCEGEVFNISLPSGVGYYIMSKGKSDKILVKNESNHFESFRHDWEEISIYDGTFNINALHIINKIRNTDKLGFDIERLSIDKKYKVFARKNCYAQGGSSNKARGIFYYDNNFVPGFVTVAVVRASENDETGIAKCIASFNTESERESFISYIDTKLVRYLLNARISAYSNMYINEVWKFVPAQVNFDHIFTDAELYQKYDLTPDEIAIIESVIKERK